MQAVLETWMGPAMGMLALGVLWLNTFLIAGAALGQRARLRVRLDELRAAERAGRLCRGEVVEGRGPNGALVTRIIHQVGRAMTVSGPDRILFTEARDEIERHGGSIQVGTERRPFGDDRFELWLAPDAPSERHAGTFDEAFRAASTQKGLIATATQTVRTGAAVWWLPGQLLSTVDPLAALSGRRSGLLAFAVAAIVFCAALTALALVPPIFGLVSTIGGALCLLFFILIQPAGVKVRNWARLPSEQLVGGVWQRA